ncbi:Retrotransposon gag domain, partial [Arabidopsis suecica]
MTLSTCRRASHVETAPPQLLHVYLDLTSSLVGRDSPLVVSERLLDLLSDNGDTELLEPEELGAKEQLGDGANGAKEQLVAEENGAKEQLVADKEYEKDVILTSLSKRFPPLLEVQFVPLHSAATAHPFDRSSSTFDLALLPFRCILHVQNQQSVFLGIDPHLGVYHVISDHGCDVIMDSSDNGDTELLEPEELGAKEQLGDGANGAKEQLVAEENGAKEQLVADKEYEKDVILTSLSKRFPPLLEVQFVPLHSAATAHPFDRSSSTFDLALLPFRCILHVQNQQSTMVTSEDEESSTSSLEKRITKSVTIAMATMLEEKLGALHLNQINPEPNQRQRQHREEPRQDEEARNYYSHASSHNSQRRRQRERPPPRDPLGKIKLKIPAFHGTNNPDTYLEWEQKIELVFNCQECTEANKVKVAATEFYDYALSWWDHLVTTRRRVGDYPVETWTEMKNIMRKRFVPSHYHREPPPRRPQEKPNWRSRSVRDKANHDYCNRDVQRSFKQTKPLLNQLSTQIDYEEVHKRVMEAFKAVEKSQKKNPSTTKSVGSETANERPSCLKREMVIQKSESDQSLPICKELIVLEENSENSNKEKVETQPYNADQNQQHLSNKEEQTENKTLKHLTSLQAKCTLSCIQSDFVLDKLTHFEPEQPSSIVLLSQLLEEKSLEGEPRSLSLISEMERPTSHVPKHVIMPFSGDYPRTHYDLSKNLFVEEKKYTFCTYDPVFRVFVVKAQVIQREAMKAHAPETWLFNLWLMGFTVQVDYDPWERLRNEHDEWQGSKRQCIMIFDPGGCFWNQMKCSPIHKKIQVMLRSDFPIQVFELTNEKAYEKSMQEEADLRTNLFQEGGDDVIMDSSDNGDTELLEPEELGAKEQLGDGANGAKEQLVAEENGAKEQLVADKEYEKDVILTSL